MRITIFWLAAIVALALTGCSTTTSNKPKKWAPQERAQIQVDLGMNYLKRNNFETARISFAKALLINPGSDRAHHAMGLWYARTGKTELALQSFATAVRLNPGNFIAVIDYGSYLCQHDETEQGLLQLNQAESNAANNVIAMTNLGIGICHAAAHNNELAKLHLRKALDLAPNLPQALSSLAEIYYAEDDFLKVRAFIERFFATGSVSAKALWLAARTEQSIGDSARAAQYAKELRRRYPGSPLDVKNSKLVPRL